MTKYKSLQFLGFDKYKVGTNGSVWSCNCYGPNSINRVGKWKKLKPTIKKRIGYSQVYLSNGIKKGSFLVHQLVLLAFRGYPKNGEECRHLNNNRSDNRLSNIIWGTFSENCNDKNKHGTNYNGEKNHFSKLNERQIKEIRKKYSNKEYKQTTLAKEYNTTQQNISMIVNYKQWKYV